MELGVTRAARKLVGVEGVGEVTGQIGVKRYGAPGNRHHQGGPQGGGGTEEL